MRVVRQVRKRRSVFVISIESTRADSRARQFRTARNLERKPMESVRSIRIEFLEVFHLSDLGRNSYQMTSVEAHELHRLKRRDRLGKRENSLPFFVSDRRQRIELIA